jgi:hypothetical protein
LGLERRRFGFWGGIKIRAKETVQKLLSGFVETSCQGHLLFINASRTVNIGHIAHTDAHIRWSQRWTGLVLPRSLPSPYTSRYVDLRRSSRTSSSEP